MCAVFWPQANTKWVGAKIRSIKWLKLWTRTFPFIHEKISRCLGLYFSILNAHCILSLLFCVIYTFSGDNISAGAKAACVHQVTHKKTEKDAPKSWNGKRVAADDFHRCISIFVFIALVNCLTIIGFGSFVIQIFLQYSLSTFHWNTFRDIHLKVALYYSHFRICTVYMRQ